MSVRIYTTPGNIIFPRPTVLREYVPGRVSRQVRYERSLSAPLGLDKGFSYAPWETSRREFTNSLIETNRRDSSLINKRRDFINDPLGTKQRELANLMSDNRRRDFINHSFETSPRNSTFPLVETTRRDFINKSLETKQRDVLIPLSESKRRDFTKSHFLNNSYLENKRKDLPCSHLETSRTNNYLENKRKDLPCSHLETSRTNSYLENKRKDLPCSHLETSRNNSYLEDKKRNNVSSYLEDKKRNNVNSHLDVTTRDFSNRHSENKVKDLDSNDTETRSKTLPATPRALRWWNKDKNQCNIDDLLEIIREPTGHYELPTDPCNEVYPGIILSDGPTALCTSMLKRMGVSHVLNAAQGKDRPGQVNTSPSFYSHSQIRYLGVEAFDHIAFRLYPYFDEASDFMQDALNTGGKVLVHCRAGISRSATLVCAFLMLRKGLSAQEAIRTVRKNRAIIPNDGFLQQLCDLNERLYKTRGP